VSHDGREDHVAAVFVGQHAPAFGTFGSAEGNSGVNVTTPNGAKARERIMRDSRIG